VCSKPRPLYSRCKNYGYPLGRRLGGPPSRSGWGDLSQLVILDHFLKVYTAVICVCVCVCVYNVVGQGCRNFTINIRPVSKLNRLKIKAIICVFGVWLCYM
jgi:hypothetical protein